MKDDVAQALRTRVARAVEEDRAAGAVLIVTEDGQPVLSEARGHADREAGREMTPDTVMRLASISKPIVTATALRLVEEGAIALGDPVTRFLPDFRPALPDGTRPEITIHHLMTHSSGLGYRFLESEQGPYARAGISDGIDQPGRVMAENLERIASAPLYFPPGAGWRYSVGIDVLGAALEVAADATLQEIVHDRISAPLGLSTLGFHAPESVELARAYRNTEEGCRPIEDGERVPLWGEAGVDLCPVPGARVAESFPSGGAGMVGSARDVHAFLDCLRAGGGPILTEESVAMMHSPQVAGHMTLAGPGFAFGYGGAVLTDPGEAETALPRGAFRWGGVYGLNWFIDFAAGRTVLLATNTAYEGMSGTLPLDIQAIIYSADSGQAASLQDR